MVTVRLRLFVVVMAAVGLLMVAAVMIPGCGGSGISTSPEREATPEWQAELAGLEQPDGVDPAVWDELCTALGEALAESGQVSRTGSTPPLADASRIHDLTAVGDGSGGATFTWSYWNLGDYDQNGLVTVSDLTPIGIYFGRNSSSADWAQARRADGDRNGEITVSDITPIAINYEAMVTGYALQASTDPYDEEAWADLAVINVSDVEPEEDGSGWVFSHTVEGVADGTYYRVVPFEDSAGRTDGIATEQLALVSYTGGTYSFRDGALSLDFPAGLVDYGDCLAVQPVSPRSWAADGRLVGGTVFALAPADLALDGTATLVYEYDSGQVPAAASEEALTLHKLVGGAWQPVGDYYADTATHSVTHGLDSFGTYAIVGIEVPDVPELYVGDYVVDSQAALDGFASYSGILGNLTVLGNQVDDLDGLSNLTWVGGSLWVGIEDETHRPEPTGITDAGGLANLERVVGDLTFEGNVELTEIALPSLIEVGGTLRVAGNGGYWFDGDYNRFTGVLEDFSAPALVSLGGLSTGLELGLGEFSLPALTQVSGDCTIASNGITSLDLPLLASVGSLAVENCKTLPSFELPALVTVDETLSIAYNGSDWFNGTEYVSAEFSSFSLPVLESVGGALTVGSSEPLLAEISFPALQSCGALNLSGGASLETLSFPELTSTGNVRIGSEALTFFSLPKLSTLDGDLNLENNDALTGFSFPDLARVERRIHIYSCPALASLAGLGAISYVGGIQEWHWQEMGVTIAHCDGLTDLNGLGSLSTVPDLRIVECDGLTSLNGINNIATIRNGTDWGTFELENCDSLESMQGFGVVNANASVLVWNNSSLTTLDGMGALSQCGSLQIENNDLLVDLSGLDGVTSCGGLSIRDNRDLESLDGLEHLVTCYGFVTIEYCHELRNLNGIDNLGFIDGHLMIRHNWDITTLEPLYDLNAGPSGWVVNGNFECYDNIDLEDPWLFIEAIGGESRIKGAIVTTAP